jgi:hypothetical protein
MYRPAHFVEAARIYREAFSSTRTPRQAVAEHFKVSSSAAAKCWRVAASSVCSPHDARQRGGRGSSIETRRER